MRLLDIICLIVLPYLEVSASPPKTCVMAIGVGSTLPWAIVTSKAPYEFKVKKIKVIKYLIIYLKSNNNILIGWIY